MKENLIFRGFKKDRKKNNKGYYEWYKGSYRKTDDTTYAFKNDYDFLDLNGLANSYSDLSPFYRYNKDKIDLNPDIYEFIGEFDYIIDNNKFKRIQSAGLLSEEFLPSYKINEE